MKKEKSSKSTEKEPYKPKKLVQTTPEEYLKARGEVKNFMTITMFSKGLSTDNEGSTIISQNSQSITIWPKGSIEAFKKAYGVDKEK